MRLKPSTQRVSFSRHLLVSLAVLCIAAPTFGIWSGCSCSRKPKPPKAEKKKKDPLKEKEKPKPDIEAEEMVIMPPDASLPPRAIKPGHWFTAKQQFKANKTDFLNGELESFTGRQDASIYDVDGTNYRLRVLRPAVLPKGQNKNIDLTFFVPSRSEQNLWLHSQLRYAGGGTRLQNPPQLGTRLRSFQNYMVVLSRRPDRYTFLKVLNTVKPPLDDMTMLDRSNRDYYVVMPAIDRGCDLPTTSMAWTTTAYVFWDDFDANILTRDQKQAMIDWINWGGQLIVSGPDSMDQLQSSFLADYLPIKAGSTYKIDAPVLQELDSKWSTYTVKPKRDMRLKLVEDTPSEAIKLELKGTGTIVEGTGNLVAERRVGRGRIVVTGIRITDRMFLNWPSLDNFLNGCLMRRPPREYTETANAMINSHWAEGINDHLAVGDVSGLGKQRLSAESMLTSKLRFFSRDASSRRMGTLAGKEMHLDLDGYEYSPQSGVGGWNDFSSCGTIARESLTESAGIKVPDANFILATLGFYLLVLVPVNWIIFKLLGRVEWAWIAVPILALAGTYFVVSLAQLDIGFARSRTEICILETQPNYARAHLTRYTGLYTSLSSTYELAFDDSTAVAQPFATGEKLAPQTERKVVTLRLGGQADPKDEEAKKSRARVRLQGFSVSSNNTGMVHSEQFLNCGGPIAISEEPTGGYKLTNNSEFTIKDIGVINRDGASLLLGWVGDLDPKQARTFQFSKKIEYSRSLETQPEIDRFSEEESDEDAVDEDDKRGKSDEPEIEFEQWEQSEVTRRELADGALMIRPLLVLAADKRRLNDGDIRMVGWTDQEMPGLQIRPKASQKTLRTVIVGNLKYGRLPMPRGDYNAYTDVAKQVKEQTD